MTVIRPGAVLRLGNAPVIRVYSGATLIFTSDPSEIMGTGPQIARTLKGQKLQDSVTWGNYTAPSGFSLVPGNPPREMRINAGSWETYVGTTVVLENATYQVRESPSTTSVPPTTTVFESNIETGIAITLTQTSSLTGTVALGQQVTVGGVAWNITPTATEYRWLRAGTPIGGATAVNYTFVADDVLQPVMPQGRVETTGVPFSDWFDLLEDEVVAPRVMPVFNVDWGAASYANGATINVGDSSFDVVSAGTPAYTPSTGNLTLLVDGSPVTLPHTAVTDQSMRWSYVDVLADTTISVLGTERRVVASTETVALADLEYTSNTADETFNFAPLFPVGATGWAITSTAGVSINASGVATFETDAFADGEITVTSDLAAGTFTLTRVPLVVSSTGETVQITYGSDTRASAVLSLTVDGTPYTTDASDGSPLTVGDFNALIAARGVPISPATVVFTQDLGQPGALDSGDILAVFQTPIWAYTISPPAPTRQWVDNLGSLVGDTGATYTADGLENTSVAVTFTDGARVVTSNSVPVAVSGATTIFTAGNGLISVSSLAPISDVSLTAGDTIITVGAA